MNTKAVLKPVLLLSTLLLAPLSSFAQPNPSEFDTNGDGQVSAAELQAGLTALFTKIDTNNDGYLTLSEAQAWREASQVALFNSLDTDKSTSLSLAELQADTKAPEKMSAKLFTLLDGDKNNVLSLEEFSLLGPGKGGIIHHFADMDTDSDGKVSQSEFLTSKPAHGHHGAPAATNKPAKGGKPTK